MCTEQAVRFTQVNLRVGIFVFLNTVRLFIQCVFDFCLFSDPLAEPENVLL